jgi:glutamyl-tRNA synthetase
MIIGRYAPSPTGALHYGNLRTALLCWLQVRLTKGTFILRIDDLDQSRAKDKECEQIISDLKWLGIDWDEGPDVGGNNGPYFQSLRTHLYEAAFNYLLESQQVFPCCCSRKDISLALNAPHSGDKATLYPGTCRPSNLTFNTTEQQTSEEQAWRFEVNQDPIEFTDQVLGYHKQNLASEVGDFVVKRKDGLFAYQLATVVDDGLMGVTDVIRGEDLIDSTARQLAVFSALNFPQPNFWHVPLMNDGLGQKMSKRDGSSSLQQWRDSGGSAEAFIGFVSHSCGLIDRAEPISANELYLDLNIQRFRETLKSAALPS